MKKDKHIKEYFEKLSGLRLSDDSRARIRQELETYADFHAPDEESVRISEQNRSIGQEAPVSASFIHNVFSKKTGSMTATILALVLIGGGTSFAAEGAVPGDVLYPMKTEVNENIKSAFAFSNESEAKLQARLAEERLEEAEELAARGELDAEASAQIRERLAAHYEEARERNQRVEEEGDLETSTIVQATLDGTLRGHADILTRIDSDAGSDSSTGIMSDLALYAGSEHTAETSGARSAMIAADTSLEAEADTKTRTDLDPDSVKKVVARAATFIADVETKLERAQSQLSAEAHARLRARLNTATDTHAEAQTSLRSEAYGAAYAQAQTAIRIAAEVQSMLKSALHLNIDIGPVIDGGNVSGGGSVSGQPPANDGGSKSGQPSQEDDGYNSFPPRETDDGGLVQPMSGADDRATETDGKRNTEVEIDGHLDVENDTSVGTDIEGTKVDTDTSTNVDAQGGAGVSL